MRRMVVRGAVALAILTAALTVPAAGAARATDCWLLDQSALGKAQAQGRCRDVFARAAPDATPPGPGAAGKAKAPRRASPPKVASRVESKTVRAPSLWERLLAGVKPAKGSSGSFGRGGIDHLAYGRADGAPAQR